ncbi:MAG: heme-binding domain-containing protein, partial [Sediminibacterium sp.]|nr:heme-binding domain-containing protein [Sediminibacterium sp.]
FFQIDKTNNSNLSKDMFEKYPCSDSVSKILKTACSDCHSNQTNYPWYTYIQPIGWWLKNHIDEGQEELNFDEFTSYKIGKQFHKFEECDELVEKKEMPLNTYTWMHPESKLSDNDRNLLTTWFKANMSKIKENYPPDSLFRKKPK